jgi:hypothetical protein
MDWRLNRALWRWHGLAIARPPQVPDETVRWAVSNSVAHVICTERQVQSQIELRVTYGTLTVASRHCKSADEAARWAEQRRHAWEKYGWKPTE